MPESVFVRGDSKSIFEGMTREQILAAIVQAIEGGTIGDVDTGFITRIKEMNAGQQLRFWVGTSAEYNQLVENEQTESNVLYIKTDDTSPENISNAIAQAAAKIEQLETDAADALDQIDDLITAYGQQQAAIAVLQSMVYIPVNGVLITLLNEYADAAALRAAVGFGTWQKYDLLYAQDHTYDIWLRTA